MGGTAVRRAALLLAAAIAWAGCGGGGEGEASGPPDLEGAVRVVTSLERWSFLAVPRDGGVVEARSVSDPGRVLWEGGEELPPVESVFLLDGPLLVLRSADGSLLRYDPRIDRLETMAEGPPGGAWNAWDGYGVLRATSGGTLLQVGSEGSWRYELASRPVWASPVDGGDVAALVETDEGPQVWLLSRGTSEPDASASGGFEPPGLTTAWGRRLVFGDGEGLVLLEVPSLSPAGTIALPSAPASLAASPSSHELYAGLADPPSLYRVSRFTAEAERMTGLPRVPRAVRPAVLGDFLLVDDGEEPLLVPLDGSETERLPGAWRSDLPLGTPDGRVLMVEEGRLVLREPGADGGSPVEAPADRWWAAVPWNPSPPRPVAASEPVGVTSDEGEAAADTAMARADTAAAGADTAAATAAEPDEVRRTRPPTGYYAVVTAARDPDGVRRLLAELRRAGYPTETQTHTDDAGRTWYRGLVGRYPTREEAEAAARQLRRERELNAWITEVRTGPDGEVVPR